MKKTARRLPTTAEKILDAPSLMDDYCKTFLTCLAINTCINVLSLSSTSYSYPYTLASIKYSYCLLSDFQYMGMPYYIFHDPLTSVFLDLNNLDWSKNNQVAIGLGNGVFLWNAISGTVEQLMEMSTEGDYISSLSWAANGKYLAIGGSNAAVQLWDVEKGKRLRVMKGHTDRVGVLAWNRHSLTR